MGINRSQGLGQTISLRAQIYDDQTIPIQASGVTVYIFEPSVETTDLDNAITSGSATNWAGGIYYYNYDIASDATKGTWSDLWYATLNGQLLSGLFSFDVVDAGSLSSLSLGQLHYNNEVTITLSSGILATDGASLENGYEFSFLTEITPCYTSSDKVVLEAGGAFPNISDSVIYRAILEASLEAGILSFAGNMNNNFFIHARREWTTCKAAAILASNAKAGNLVGQKSLGDFSVSYNLNALNDLLDRIAACLGKWEAQLRTGGFATRPPAMVVKGELDPDRPQIGRLWRTTATGNISRRIPAANEKNNTPDSRRWRNDFSSSRWGRGW